MSIRDFFNKDNESIFSGGDFDCPFLKKPQKRTTLVGRFYMVLGSSGETEEPCFRTLSHGFPEEVCPKTLDRDAYCEKCERMELLYAAGDKKEGAKLVPKTSYWFCFVPLMSEFDPDPFTLQLPYSVTQQIWAALAMQGGWKSPEADLEDEDCIKAIEKGIKKCYGNKGHDFIIKWNPQLNVDKSKKDPRKYWTSPRFSDKPGKQLSLDLETPDFAEKYRRVKKLGEEGSEAKMKAPPPEFDAMSVKELKEFAKTNDVGLTGLRKKAEIIERIKEEIEG